MKKETFFQKIREITSKHHSLEFYPIFQELDQEDLINLISCLIRYNSDTYISNYTSQGLQSDIEKYKKTLENPILFYINLFIEDELACLYNPKETYNYFYNFEDLFFENINKLFHKKNILLKNKKVLQDYVKKIFKNDYKKFLTSMYWQIISEEKKRRADYSCQLCGNKNNLNTHHSTYDIFGLEIYYMDKLIVLCNKCHSKFHNKEVK